MSLSGCSKLAYSRRGKSSRLSMREKVALEVGEDYKDDQLKMKRLNQLLQEDMMDLNKLE